jgi:hypothetical protein
MKSVTISLSNVAEKYFSLTAAQKAGLYSVIANGSITQGGVTYQYTDSIAYLDYGSFSSSDGYISVYNTNQSAQVGMLNIKVDIKNGYITTGSTSYKFTGTVTLYYFA